MEQMLIAGIGEILWDVLPDGEVLGGAPVNFVFHVNRLGAKGVAISVVGDDERGRKAFKELESRNMDVAGICVLPGQTTGFVEAVVDDQGQASYHFPDNVAWDHLTINAYARGLKDKLDAVCFGSLAQRGEKTRTALYGFLDTLPGNTLKVYDVNFRQDFFNRQVVESSLARADMVKLNHEELPVLAGLLNIKGGNAAQAMKTLLDRYHLKMVICTRGGQGSVIVTADAVSEHAGVTANVVDTIGAGDAFTAAAVTGFLKKDPLDLINDHANQVAAAVCACKGAMPDGCRY